MFRRIDDDTVEHCDLNGMTWVVSRGNRLWDEYEQFLNEHPEESCLAPTQLSMRRSKPSAWTLLKCALNWLRFKRGSSKA